MSHNQWQTVNNSDHNRISSCVDEKPILSVSERMLKFQPSSKSSLKLKKSLIKPAKDAICGKTAKC